MLRRKIKQGEETKNNGVGALREGDIETDIQYSRRGSHVEAS